MNTVADKIIELDRERKNPNRVLGEEERKRREEAEFQSYWTLASQDTVPRNRVKSLRTQVQDKAELLRLRVKFEKHPMRARVDPNRPENLDEDTRQVDRLLKLLEKHKDDHRWGKAPVNRDDKEPMTLDEFVALLTLPKGA